MTGYASWKIVHAAVSLFIIIWHDFSDHLYTMSSCPFISAVLHEVELIVQSSMTFAFARALYYIKITHLWINVSIVMWVVVMMIFMAYACHCLILLSVFQWGEHLLCNYPLNINTWWLGLCISHRPVIWRVLLAPECEVLVWSCPRWKLYMHRNRKGILDGPAPKYRV